LRFSVRAPAARVVALLLLASLTACTVAPTRPQAEREQLWQARSAQLAHIDAWDLEGRLAVHAGDQGGQMALRWHRQGETEEVDITGPLGKRLLQLVQDASGARAVDADRRTYAGRDAQSLLFEATGWQIPLSGLNYWVLGLPIPGVPHEQRLDDEGRLESLRQLGWTVRFLDYGRYQGVELPRRLFLEIPDPALELRLVVQAWTLIQ
jgi:outer membrane lipoprotein LolB